MPDVETTQPKQPDVDDLVRSLAGDGFVERPCMCCTKPFPSEHKFNRLCQRCKDEASGSMDI
jgi:hypothetical protein